MTKGNRELKFRIWDGKKFLYNSHNSIYDREHIYLNIDGSKYCRYGNQNYHLNLVVQQFTGLKDRNGKDIYEGDVLLYSLSYQEVATYGTNNDINEVIFESGSFKLLGGDLLSELVDYDGMTLREEIIGNIFENPDLISN